MHSEEPYDVCFSVVKWRILWLTGHADWLEGQDMHTAFGWEIEDELGSNSLTLLETLQQKLCKTQSEHVFMLYFLVSLFVM
jgi:hypothetical protein